MTRAFASGLRVHVLQFTRNAFDLSGVVLFDVPLSIDAPLAFALAVPMCALAVGMLGLMMAATFVLYRAAFQLGIAMQYPVWIVTGLLVPLSLLPAFVEPLS